METNIESQQSINESRDLTADKLQLKKEYDDWMAEQNRLSDDHYGIVSVQDTESE